MFGSVVNFDLVLELRIKADRELTWQWRDGLTRWGLISPMGICDPILGLATVF